MSHECRENIVQHSPMIRAIIVRHSCDCRKYVLITHSVRNVNMVAMTHFCRQNVSQISLKIVANCSHPSEILTDINIKDQLPIFYRIYFLDEISLLMFLMSFSLIF